VLVFMNQSFSEPIEDIHWEIETPTTLGNLIRQNWVGPLFIWIVFDVVAIVVLRDQLGLQSFAAVPLGLAIGTAVCWVFMFAHARGWIHDE